MANHFGRVLQSSYHTCPVLPQMPQALSLESVGLHVCIEAATPAIVLPQHLGSDLIIHLGPQYLYCRHCGGMRLGG